MWMEVYISCGRCGVWVMWFGWLVSRKKLVHVDAICRFIFVQVVPSGFGATQRKIGGKLPLFSARPRVERPALRLWQLGAISMSMPLETCLRATRFRGVNCLHVRCLPARRFRKTAAQCLQNGPPQAESLEAEDRSINGMRAVAFVAVLSFTLAPGKAQAWGHDWKPRRHHRRMTDSRAAFDIKSVLQVPFPAPHMHCKTYLSCSFLF